MQPIKFLHQSVSLEHQNHILWDKDCTTCYFSTPETFG